MQQSVNGGGVPSPSRVRVGSGGIGWNPGAPAVLSESTDHSVPVSWLASKGYIRYYWKSHPKSNPSTGALYEHRAVAYILWGDAIDGMHVDHKNGIKTDNRPENLQLLTRSEHAAKTAANDGNHALSAWVRENHPAVYDEWANSRLSYAP